MEKIKIVLDTNHWISFLISRHFDKLDYLFNHEKLVLLFSQSLLEEFIKVVRRPKFQKYFSEEDIHDLLLSFEAFGKMIDIQSVVNICRDSKDNFLLALCKDGKADYLVTGDADLLILERYEQTQIITYRDFESLEL